MIVDKNDIRLMDVLGMRIELGDTFQAYRPRTVRKVASEVILPAAWFFGQLQLNLEKGLVLHVHEIYYPEGVAEGETDMTKVGWRLKVSRNRFALLKTGSLLKEEEVMPFLKFATGRGYTNLKKHKLLQ